MVGIYHLNNTVEGTPAQDNVSQYSYTGTVDYVSIYKAERLSRYFMVSLAWSFKAKPKK